MLFFVVRSLIRSRGSSSVIGNVNPYTTSSTGSVSYLTRVWGLPPEQAKSAAKFVTVENTKSADSVFKLLKSYGFGNTDVAKLISKHPGYVAADAENDLRQKIEYLTSLGISESHIPSILCLNKGILSNHLKNIVPVFDFFKGFIKGNEDLVRAIRNASRMVKSGSGSSIRKCVIPNTLTLEACGVPYHVLRRLMVFNPGVLRSNIDSFNEVVKRVEEMGFEPGKVSFILALKSMIVLSKELWQKKRQLLIKLGWSEEEFLSAFKKQPMLMVCSESKLKDVMDFLVKKLGFTPSETAMYPNLLLLSLKRRMVPRCSVLQVLMSSGKFKKQTSVLFSALTTTNSKFLNKYVTEFEKDLPDVVKAYRGELEFKGFTDGELESCQGSRGSSSVIGNVNPYTTSSTGSVSYLTRVWGLPPEQAKSAAKFVTVENTKSADSVFKLLKSYGFGNTDVAKLISKHPGYVAADAENDLRQKIEYLTSLGISESHLPSILCLNTGILSNRLKNIVPVFDFFKGFIKGNEDLVRAIRNSSRVVTSGSGSSIRKCVITNTSTLEARGVPYHVLRRLMVFNLGVLRSNIDSFNEIVKRVEEMGFEPGKVSFILALKSMIVLSKELWQKKRQLLIKLGWSEEEFLSAFKKQPMLMVCSESKLKDVTDFLVKKLGFTPSETAMYPNLLLLSLKRRMVPRCSVLQVLMSSGKFKKQTSVLFSALTTTNSKFLNKYVTEFEKDLPDVVKAYRGELEFKGFTDDCES